MFLGCFVITKVFRIFTSNYHYGKIHYAMSTIRIKNMVCQRCVDAVEKLLAGLGYTVKHVELGKADLQDEIDDGGKKAIAAALGSQGFELLDDSLSIMIEQIRHHVLAWVRLTGEHPVLSDYLQSKMSKDYSLLSKTFSETRGMTIERYSIMLRIEHAKELLSYEELTASEIAYRMGYSSAAHFSMQFKKETGMTPTQFRHGSTHLKRQPIDSI